MTGSVKRRYDASARQAEAERTRAALIAAARGLLLAEGYRATTVPRVAALCGVSVESVYKRFGGRSGLVRAVVEDGLRGLGPMPAEERSDALSSDDPVALLRGWGRLTVEVAPRVAPLLLRLRAAAAIEADLSPLADQLDRDRRTRMALNARRLADAGHLRAGVTAGDAADVLWTFSSPELYDLLVLRSGWPPSRFGEFVADGLVAALLPASAGRSAADVPAEVWPVPPLAGAGRSAADLPAGPTPGAPPASSDSRAAPGAATP